MSIKQRTIYLLPPSEGKATGGTGAPLGATATSKHFPYQIAINATEKELKCTGARYEQGIELNRTIATSPTLPAIERYTGTMFKAIDYASMSADQQSAFNDAVLILSGYFGFVSPTDPIPNYKLPMSTKLKQRRGVGLTDTLNALPQSTHIVDLLSGVYSKCIKRDQIVHSYERPEFLIDGKKATHGVKGLKGSWVREVFEY